MSKVSKNIKEKDKYETKENDSSDSDKSESLNEKYFTNEEMRSILSQTISSGIYFFKKKVKVKIIKIKYMVFIMK